MKTWAAICAALLLVGCDSLIAKPKPNDLVCSPIEADTPGSLEMCLHKWGYRLAGAPGSYQDLAPAVMNSCQPLIDQTAKAFDPGVTQKAAYNSAYFYLVQARAGHCAIP